jgi:rod shape determining protein RodA
MVLVVLQPDVGTALVYVAVFSVMVFVSGTNSKLIWGVIVTMIIMMIPLWYFINNSASDNFRFTRILMWLNPDAYPDEARQIINGQIAIGSGGLFGKGIVSPGSFASLGYISDDHTDFIFAIVCESFGLVGGISLVLGYVLLIGRLIVLAVRTKDPYGSYLIVGVMAMLLFHVVENIGMVIGLLPVTGIPLPFVSYGGSNMLTNMMGIGLVLNVVMRSRQHEQRQHTSSAKVVALKRE